MCVKTTEVKKKQTKNKQAVGSSTKGLCARACARWMSASAFVDSVYSDEITVGRRQFSKKDRDYFAFFPLADKTLLVM